MNHIVKPGETLSAIALDYRRPLQSLIAANPLINPNMLIPGQVIFIPGLPDPKSIPYTVHVYVNELASILPNGTAVYIRPSRAYPSP
ncbi:LysM peptidoglycan-binding domain-containing protein [Bacillus songklensis]|uniref:LysM peptidoglycan-binding domain-containing protein n=1 Tax=Bacillus songklensis TaxID=1069116 RepID=A0ABV8B327_9BACI